MERDAYSIYGELSRPPLLLVHGMRLGRQIWDEHARILCDEFCVLTVDLPGHAALAGVPFSTHTVNAALAALIDSLPLVAPPLCVGYSLGGYIVNGFANEYPEHTSALALAGASVDVVGWRAIAYWTVASVAGAMPVPMLNATLRAFFRATLPKRVADLIVPFDFDRDVFAAAAEACDGKRFSDALRSYGRPVLLINGQFDPMRLDERRFAKAARAPVAVMTGTDHVAPLRHPREFAEIIRVFAREVFTASRFFDSRSSSDKSYPHDAFRAPFDRR